VSTGNTDSSITYGDIFVVQAGYVEHEGRDRLRYANRSLNLELCWMLGMFPHPTASNKKILKNEEEFHEPGTFPEDMSSELLEIRKFPVLPRSERYFTVKYLCVVEINLMRFHTFLEGKVLTEGKDIKSFETSSIAKCTSY
ncbi:hypothetical protein CEXT_731741, partial [Caerostris extrusa]